MLGTIEDLERDIEQFQSNVAASKEMYTLLSQMLEQIRQQNTSFDSKSRDLLDRLDGIPAAMDTANAASNAAVKKEVSAEVDRAINNFSQEQDKYVQLLEQVKQQIQLYIDQSKAQTAAFGDKTSLLVAKVEGIPASVDAANNASNAQMRTDVKNELEVALRSFSAEQSKYLQSLEQMQQTIQGCIDQSQKQVQSFDEKSAELITKVETVSEQIKSDTRTSLADHRSAIDVDIDKRNAQFAETQQRYVSEMEETSGRLKSCEDQLLTKYQDFLQTLEKTNLSNLYEQNQKLQDELNKRTAILMVISAISVILGIVGLIL